MRLTNCPFSLLIFFNAAATFAQQTTLQSSYQANWQTVNPAAVDRIQYMAGSGGKNTSGLLINCTARNQWLGQEGSPKRVHLSGEWIADRNGSASPVRLGFLLAAQKAGTFGTYQAYFNYTYRLSFGQQAYSSVYLSFAPGFLWQTLNKTALVFQDPDEPALGERFNRAYFDMAAGVFYTKRFNGAHGFSVWYCGLSIPPGTNITKNSLTAAWAKEGFRPPVYFINGLLLGPQGSQGGRGVNHEPSFIIRAPGYGLLNGVSKNWNLDINYRIYVGSKSNMPNPTWFGLGYGLFNKMISAEFGFHVIQTNNRIFRINIASGKSFSTKDLIDKPSIELGIALGWVEERNDPKNVKIKPKKPKVKGDRFDPKL